jgi:hypothetical protein
MGKKNLYIKTTDNDSFENEKTALRNEGQNGGTLLPSGKTTGHEMPTENHGAQNADSIPYIGFDFDSDDTCEVDEDEKNVDEDG